MANASTNPFAAEHGRIRLGEKGGRGGRTALKTFRFTSSDGDAIEALSRLYGGVARRWEDPKASPKKQWEVISEADEIEVLVPQGALTIQYERWGGGGMLSYCDGEEVVVYKGEHEEVKDCVCLAKGEMLCDVSVKLRCILPELPTFGGTWRLQSKSEFVAREMPAIEKLLQGVQTQTIVPARIRLEERQTQGGKHQFIVPKLEILMGFSQMLDASNEGAQVLMPGSAGELEEGPDAEVIEITRGETDE